MELNLSNNAVDNYWKKTDPKFYSLLENTKKLESWTLCDEPQFQTKLTELVDCFKNWKTSHWSRSSEEVTTIMKFLPIGHFALLLHWLDSSYPGLSFHYVMEARHKEGWDAGELLLERLKIIKQWNYLGLLFAPMRTRLIMGLLEDDEDEDED